MTIHARRVTLADGDGVIALTAYGSTNKVRPGWIIELFTDAVRLDEQAHHVLRGLDDDRGSVSADIEPPRGALERVVAEMLKRGADRAVWFDDGKGLQAATTPGGSWIFL